MRRNTFVIFVMCAILLATSGCAALLIGGAAAGGTAVWQGGKVTSEESISMERGVAASKAALKAKKISVTDQVTKNDVTQLRGETPAGDKVAVDVFSLGERSARFEIRVGLNDETAARDLLKEIKRRL
jgi:hypothetical protein